MMIHPTDECPQIAEHSFNFRSQLKLPSFVNVRLVLYRPPRVDTPVDSSSVGLQPAPRFDKFIQKLTGVGLVWGLVREDAEGDLARSDLLRHHQRHVFEVR